MFTNTDNVIDSRDIIERITELESILRGEYEELDTPLSFDEWIAVTIFEHDTEGYEYKILIALDEECEQYADDWEHGVSLIHESYFKAYQDELIQDCFELPKELPFWMKITYNYDALKQDYTEIDLSGETYFIRSV